MDILDKVIHEGRRVRSLTFDKESILECLDKSAVQINELRTELAECKKDGWISVDERWPNKNDKGAGATQIRCLVNVNGYGVHIDRFVFKAGQFYKYYGYVTHWMLLPAPPQANEKG